MGLERIEKCRHCGKQLYSEMEGVIHDMVMGGSNVRGARISLPTTKCPHCGHDQFDENHTVTFDDKEFPIRIAAFFGAILCGLFSIIVFSKAETGSISGGEALLIFAAIFSVFAAFGLLGRAFTKKDGSHVPHDSGALAEIAKSEASGKNSAKKRGENGEYTCDKCNNTYKLGPTGIGQCPKCQRVLCSNCYVKGTGQVMGFPALVNVCPDCKAMLKPPPGVD